MKCYILPLILFALLVMKSAVAQERTAGGSLDTQMTWTALSNSVKGVSDRVEAVTSRVEQSVVCGKKGLIYAPGVDGVDTDGCLPAATNTTTQNTINRILACNAAGQVYSSSTNACINTVARAPNCSVHMTSTSANNAPTCPAGYSVVGTGAVSTNSCNTDRTSCASHRAHFICYRLLCQ